MATPETCKYRIPKFWDDEFKTLDYVQEPFNDPVSLSQWLAQGYQEKICGHLCDMRHRLPTWARHFITLYEEQGWKDVGIAFYCMPTGTVMPVHQDLTNVILSYLICKEKRKQFAVLWFCLKIGSQGIILKSMELLM